MNLQYYYYFFKHALTPVFCDHILQYAKDKQEKEHEAKVGPGNPQVNLETRKTKVNWISDRWVYKELRPLVFEANKKAGWNFNINNSEPVQITRYKLNHFYGWHSDSDSFPYQDPYDPSSFGKLRKISMTVCLTDSNEYQGGDFKIKDIEGKELVVKEARTKGTVIVFPSFVSHTVTPVTSGERMSLVMWTLGPPFV